MTKTDIRVVIASNHSTLVMAWHH